MSARISVPPDLGAAFGEAVQAAIKDLKRQGYGKAYICERSFEIEDAVFEQILKPTPVKKLLQLSIIV